MDVVLTVVVGLVIAVGILGTVLPLLPGLGLVWLAMLAYGLFAGFGWEGWAAMAVATGLGVAGLYLNVRIPQKEAATSGLTVRGQLVGLGLAIVGFFVVPVIGAPLGFVVGVYLVRFQATNDRSQAWASTVRIIRSLVKASAVQAALAVTMALVWVIWVVTG
jgi:uncharacterized protein